MNYVKILKNFKDIFDIRIITFLKIDNKDTFNYINPFSDRKEPSWGAGG